MVFSQDSTRKRDQTQANSLYQMRPLLEKSKACHTEQPLLTEFIDYTHHMLSPLLAPEGKITSTCSWFCNAVEG